MEAEAAAAEVAKEVQGAEAVEGAEAAAAAVAAAVTSCFVVDFSWRHETIAQFLASGAQVQSVVGVTDRPVSGVGGAGSGR